MTVSTTSNKVSFLADGSTVIWPFTFPGYAAADILVYVTDSSGNVTLISSALYSITLNAAIGPNPTGIGGSVTYPTSGPAIALGNTITIYRSIPLTQPTSLANQSTLYQTVIEAEFDLLVMQLQQLNEQLGRQITVAVSDPNPATLPAVAQRENLWAAFDSSGNMIGAAAPSGSVPISSAMIPVVEAATLALARDAMGLGGMAVEGIGAGLQDDGAGNARTYFPGVADTTNQAVTSAFHTTRRFASGALTYTCPRANTLWSSFFFSIFALNNSVTIAIDANDSFSGAASGVSLTIPPGSYVTLSTNAAASGLWHVTPAQPVDLGPAHNLQINASVATNALTIAIKDRNGNDPSTASPILLTFRDPTVANGDPVARAVTSALSIVVPNTATLGTVSAVPSRQWIVAFDNAGTIVLGIITCSDATHVYPLDESSAPSGVAISAGAGTAGVFYTASTITSKPFRILGYIESTQATAGAWATTPSKVQLFGPGVRKPGDIVQTLMSFSGALDSTATAIPVDDTTPQSGEGKQFFTLSITPIAKANLLFVDAHIFGSGSSNGYCTAALFQDAVASAVASACGEGDAAQFSSTNVALLYTAVASVSVSTTFNLRAGPNTGTLYLNGSSSGARRYAGTLGSYLRIQEIMG